MAPGTDAEDFIINGRVQWGELGITMFISAMLAWFSGFTDFVYEVVTGPQRFIEGSLAFVRETVLAIFTIPLSAISEGFDAAAEELPVVGGPFEFALGVGITIAWFWLLLTILSRLEVLG